MSNATYRLLGLLNVVVVLALAAAILIPAAAMAAPRHADPSASGARREIGTPARAGGGRTSTGHRVHGHAHRA